jgi:hypothetical protein
VGSRSFSATFTPGDTDNYNLVIIAVYVNVSAALPPYTAPSGITAIYGDTLADIALPEGWTWDEPLTTPVGNAGDTTHRATFIYGDPNYQFVTETLTIAVAKAPAPAIVFPQPGAITAGQTLGDVPLTGGSTQYGRFAWVDDASTRPAVGTNQFTLVFIPNDDAQSNYDFAESYQQLVTVVVNPQSTTPTTPSRPSTPTTPTVTPATTVITPTTTTVTTPGTTTTPDTTTTPGGGAGSTGNATGNSTGGNADSTDIAEGDAPLAAPIVDAPSIGFSAAWQVIWPWLLAALLVLAAALFFFFIFWKRRRRGEEEDTQKQNYR